MKVYIAGKITGDPGYRDKFAAVEIQLFHHGHTVLNPAGRSGQRRREARKGILRVRREGDGRMERLTYFKDGQWRVNFDGVQYQADFVDRLAAYEDTGLSPEKVSWMKEVVEAAFDNDTSRIERAHNLHVADKDGRVVVLPCKVGEQWVDEDGRAVRITAVIVSREPFGENINIYFDYEDATPDDAGSDCAANWDYFSRHYTCIEVERAMEGKKDGKT